MVSQRALGLVFQCDSGAVIGPGMLSGVIRWGCIGPGWWTPVLAEPPSGVAVHTNLSLFLDTAVCSVNIAPGIAMAPNRALGFIVAVFAGIVWPCLRLSLG